MEPTHASTLLLPIKTTAWAASISTGPLKTGSTTHFIILSTMMVRTTTLYLYKCGIPYQQQEQLLRNRFNAAEEFYDQTNDPAYRNIARDIKTVVTENLAARHTLTFPW